MEFIEKLAALVPPPRFHMIRYHGVLAQAAKWRSLIIPAVPAGSNDAVCGHDGESRASGSISRPRNYTIVVMGLNSSVACSTLTLPNVLNAAGASTYWPRSSHPMPFARF